jgi:hypothetical protein
MLITGIQEPEISRQLLDLCHENYINLEPFDEYIDRWTKAPRAARVTKNKMIKPVTLEEAKRLIATAVLRARDVNANPNSELRVTEMRLVGGILSTKPNQMIDEIIFDISTEARQASRQRKSAKNKMSDDDLMDHIYDEIRRRSISLERNLSWMAGISPIITVCREDYLRTSGAVYGTIFKYDPMAEQEVLFDQSRKSYEPRPFVARPIRGGSQDEVSGPVQTDWPKQPDVPSAFVEAEDHRLHLAQHMWTKGASFGEIASKTALSESAVHAYLAARRFVPKTAPQYHSSLRMMINSMLPARIDYNLQVDVTSYWGSAPNCRVSILDPQTKAETAFIQRHINGHFYLKGNCECFPLIEAIADAACLWLAKMKTWIKNIRYSAHLEFGPGAIARSKRTSETVDLRPIGMAMLERLQFLLPKPRMVFSAHDAYMLVELSDKTEISFRTHNEGEGETPMQPLHFVKAFDLWDLCEDYRRSLALRPSDTVTIAVSGSQLPNRGDVAGEVVDHEGKMITSLDSLYDEEVLDWQYTETE